MVFLSKKIESAEGSGVLSTTLTGLLREVLVQVRWSGDMQDQVRDGNEQTGALEDRRV